jgi:hypothetical protein
VSTYYSIFRKLKYILNSKNREKMYLVYIFLNMQVNRGSCNSDKLDKLQLGVVRIVTNIIRSNNSILYLKKTRDVSNYVPDLYSFFARESLQRVIIQIMQYTINNTCVLTLSHLVSFLTHIEVNIWVWSMVFNATFNHISVIL